MLVLTRSKNEEIRIGDDVIIRVLDVKGDRVRIGVQAPPEVPVHRQEVYLEIERANREAVNVKPGGLSGIKELMKKTDKGKRSSGSARKKKDQKTPDVNMEVNHGS